MLDPLNNESYYIRLISTGDEKAFEYVYNYYRDKIYTVALMLTRSTTVAEEIVEDVFLKVWLRRTSLDEIENFGAYLYTIARNECYRVLNQIAKNYKVILLAETDASFVHNDTHEYLLGREVTSILQKAIEKLPNQQKQVYRLIKEDNLKRNEVAQILQIKPETVKFHLAQAMKNIRAYCMSHLSSSIVFILLLSYFLENKK